MPGQRVDDVAGEMGAIGRSQRRPLLAFEVIMQDDFMAVAGNDEVDARALEVAGEEQMRIRNNNGVGRRMARNGSNMDMRTGVSTQAVRRQVGKFAGQAQNGTVAAMVKSYTISIV
jgi:hypothetical protein